MNNQYSLLMQLNKMKAGYQSMSTERLAELKGKVLSCFDSVDMQKYLYEHFEELTSSQLIDIIVGALRPLEFKLNLMTELAIAFPHLLETSDSFFDFEPYVEQYEAAFDNMRGCDEGNIYLLKQFSYHPTYWELIDPIGKFPSPLAAIHRIKEIQLELSAPAFTWFEIEKYENYHACEPSAVYTLSSAGEVWDYSSGMLDHSFGISNALELNLPVPFEVGDIIRIDCQPFAPPRYNVVISIGDNIDCCGVQCLYEKADSTKATGALKHAAVFDERFTPAVSPLYRAERVINGLPAEENHWKEISQAVFHCAKLGL